MVYGAWGVGKTPLLATAPDPCIISAEKGMLSLRRTHTPFVEVSGYRSLIDIFNWASTSAEAKKFFTLGVDSLSEIVEVLLQEEKRTAKDPRKAFYNVYDAAVGFARGVRDLPGRTVVLVCKEEFSKDINGTNLFQPMVPGNKLGQALPYYFDEVLRMIVWPGTQQRVLCTQNTYQHQARDRSGMLAEHEQPDLTVVFRKILGV